MDFYDIFSAHISHQVVVASMLVITGHQLSIPGNGDFKIDDDVVIEVGGKGKDISQVWDVKRSYLAADDIHGKSLYGCLDF